jgi:hypothetical protein
MEAPLNIALSQTPARQTTWRVVRIAAATLGAWLLILAGYRMCFGWNDVVPSANAVHLRIPNNPATVAHLKSLTNGTEVIAGIPWSLDALLQDTRRVLNVSFEDDGSTVVILDRALNSEEQGAFASFGATVIVHKNETIITDAAEEKSVQHNVLYGIMQTLFTQRDATLAYQKYIFGVSLAADTATIHGFSALAAPAIDSTPTSDTLLFASFGPNDLLNLSSRVFTQNTPGLAAFFGIAEQNGLSANIRGGADALRYTFAVPITPETRTMVNESTIMALAKELTEISTIDGVTDYLDDGTKTTALRSREEATIVLRDESPYRFLTATSSTGSVTVTETPAYLTVSNDISGIITPATPSCLPGSIAFIKPAIIETLLPEPIQYQPQTLTSFLWRATTIASTSSTTRICSVN